MLTMIATGAGAAHAQADNVSNPHEGNGDSDVGAVYVNNNATPRNSVVILSREADGTLKEQDRVGTGGRGTGNILESQGALVLSEGGEWLFAANAGSDDISVFAVIEGGGLVRVDKVSSGGDRPLSLAVSEDLLYVLNAGSAGNITAFTVNPNGSLTPLADSTRSLSTTAIEPCPPLVTDLGDPDAVCSVAGPAQIQFSPGGNVIVVTERLTNLIDTYTVGDDGRTTGFATHPAAGMTPFGFDFAKRGRLIVSNNFLDGSGLGGAASYLLSEDSGVVATVTENLPNGQTASCWMIVTNDGRYAYVSNPLSGTLTSYTIQNDGGISLLRAVAGVTGEDPRDPGLSDNGRYLYILNNFAGTVNAFRVNGNGRLKFIEEVSGIVPGAVGLAAR